MRLGPWHRIATLAALALVALTGVLWFVLHDLIEDEPSRLAHMLLVLHGVSAYAALIVFGSLFPLHMRSGWLRRRNVASGASMLIAMAVLIVTALALYYGDEETRPAARWVHIGVGLAACVMIGLHMILGRTFRAPEGDESSRNGRARALRMPHL